MFFEKFPLIEYNGRLVRNLLANATIDENSVPYHSYTIKDQDKRSDVIAHKYYGAFQYDWLVFLSNKVIDPYYDLGLGQLDFDEYLKKKYGSIESAQEKIVFWRNNWRIDDSVLSPAGYNSLPGNRKRYYQEIINVSGLISGYERKKEDWSVKTNRIDLLTFSSEHDFVIGDKVIQGSAEGIVDSADEYSIRLINCSGTFLTGSLGGLTVTLAATLSKSFEDDEDIFWQPVTAFEYESELNDQKREIRLIDNRFKDRAEKQIEDLFE